MSRESLTEITGITLFFIIFVLPPSLGIQYFVGAIPPWDWGGLFVTSILSIILLVGLARRVR